MFTHELLLLGKYYLIYNIIMSMTGRWYDDYDDDDNDDDDDDDDVLM